MKGSGFEFRPLPAQDTKLNQDDPVDMWAEVRGFNDHDA